MRKKILCIMLCAATLLLASCGFKVNPDNANKVGNSPVNIAHLGYMATQDGYIYYKHPDKVYVTLDGGVAVSGYSLYRMKEDGSGNTKLMTANLCEDINVVGEDLYLTNYDSEKKIKRLYKTTVKGASPQLISEERNVYNVSATKDYVFYIDQSGGESGSDYYLYRYDCKTGETKRLFADVEVGGVMIDGDTLIVDILEIDTDGTYTNCLSRTDLNGESIVRLTRDNGASAMYLDDGYIYFEEKKSGFLRRVKSDGSGEVEDISKIDSETSTVIIGDYIYFSDQEKMWKVNKNNKDDVIQLGECYTMKPLLNVNGTVCFLGIVDGKYGYYKLIDDQFTLMKKMTTKK